MVGNGTIPGVEPVALAIGLFVLLIAVGGAFAWQERRPAPEGSIIYGVEDSIEFIMDGLSDETRSQLRRRDVRRILEWEMRYLQDPGLHGDHGVPVIGGLEAAEYAQQQSLEHGSGYDGAVILEVLDLQAAYLGALGAIGAPVEADEVDRISRTWTNQAASPPGSDSDDGATKTGDGNAGEPPDPSPV